MVSIPLPNLSKVENHMTKVRNICLNSTSKENRTCWHILYYLKREVFPCTVLSSVASRSSLISLALPFLHLFFRFRSLNPIPKLYHYINHDLSTSATGNRRKAFELPHRSLACLPSLIVHIFLTWSSAARHFHFYSEIASY